MFYSLHIKLCISVSMCKLEVKIQNILQYENFTEFCDNTLFFIISLQHFNNFVILSMYSILSIYYLLSISYGFVDFKFLFCQLFKFCEKSFLFVSYVYYFVIWQKLYRYNISLLLSFSCIIDIVFNMFPVNK